MKQKRSFVFLAVVVSLLSAGLCAPAAAQYVWLDRTGHKVFSDRPPPMDVPERSILRQPGASASPAAPPAAPEPVQAPRAATAATAAAPRPPARDGELESRRQAAEAAEAGRRKAEEERLALARADNCARARQAAATFDSGMRIAQVDARGERSFMDDQTRAAESARAQSIVASDCR